MIRPLADIEREAILAACLETRDCQRAARELGIGRTTLYRKLREYGEPLSRFRASKPVKIRESVSGPPMCPICQFTGKNTFAHLVKAHGWTPEDAGRFSGNPERYLTEGPVNHCGIHGRYNGRLLRCLLCMENGRPIETCNAMKIHDLVFGK